MSERISKILQEEGSQQNLVFFVGSAISEFAPSNLPTKDTLITEILNYTCNEAELPKIKEVSNIRFESLLLMLHQNWDPSLKILDFLQECTTPNPIHFALAEYQQNGNQVLLRFQLPRSTNICHSLQEVHIKTNKSQIKIKYCSKTHPISLL